MNERSARLNKQSHHSASEVKVFTFFETQEDDWILPKDWNPVSAWEPSPTVVHVLATRKRRVPSQ